MRRMMMSLMVVAVVILSGVSPAWAQKKITAEKVRKAIDKGAKALLAMQGENGSWDPLTIAEAPKTPEEAHKMGHGVKGSQFSGKTALCLYALMKCGYEPSEYPQIKKGVDWLTQSKSFGNYALGMRNHAWNYLPDKYLEYFTADTQLMVDSLCSNPNNAVHYTTTDQTYDNSVTQYNTLGVWEAAKRGITFSGDYWERVEKHFIEDQTADGAWGYKGQTGVRISMAAAGLTCMFIVNDFLHNHEYKTPGAGHNNKAAVSIKKGLEWFDANYKYDKSLYAMVGVERVGVASGYKYFNGKDWYMDGLEVIVPEMNKNNGAITGNFWGAKSGNDVSIAYAMLFLARGLDPLFINKLKIDGFDWNNRPQDCRYITQWIGDQVEQQMLWQVIGIDRSAEEWMDAPILYLASHKELKLDPGQQAKLKKYMDLGGLMFTTADGRSSSFDSSIETLARELYPELAGLKPIPMEDELYNLVFKIDRRKAPKLLGLHNGVRYILIHCPEDISWTLHSNNTGNQAVFQTMANIFHYATEKGKMKAMLDSGLPTLKSGASGPAKPVARVKYNGNWNPEPHAWTIEAIALKNANKADPQVEEVEIGSLGASGKKFAHVMVTPGAQLDGAQIKEFANAGGTILLEATGGNKASIDAVNAIVAAAFPDADLEPVQPDHPIITGQGYGGFDCSHIAFRPFTTLKFNMLRTSPQLLSVKIGGQPRVLISYDDFSNAMLDQPVWGVSGYAPNSAHKLMGNILLWANQ